MSGEGRGGGGELSRWRLAHGQHHSHQQDHIHHHHHNDQDHYHYNNYDDHYHYNHDDYHRYHDDDDDLQVRVGIASQNSALCLSVDAAPGLLHHDHLYHSEMDNDDIDDDDQKTVILMMMRGGREEDAENDDYLQIVFGFLCRACTLPLSQKQMIRFDPAGSIEAECPPPRSGPSVVAPPTPAPTPTLRIENVEPLLSRFIKLTKLPPTFSPTPPSWICL